MVISKTSASVRWRTSGKLWSDEDADGFSASKKTSLHFARVLQSSLTCLPQNCCLRQHLKSFGCLPHWTWISTIDQVHCCVGSLCMVLKKKGTLCSGGKRFKVVSKVVSIRGPQGGWQTQTCYQQPEKQCAARTKSSLLGWFLCRNCTKLGVLFFVSIHLTVLFSLTETWTMPKQWF